MEKIGDNLMNLLNISLFLGTEDKNFYRKGDNRSIVSSISQIFDDRFFGLTRLRFFTLVNSFMFFESRGLSETFLAYFT